MHRAEVIGLTVNSIELDSDIAAAIGKAEARAGSCTTTGPGRG
jgi:hypothetical protein